MNDSSPAPVILHVATNPTCNNRCEFCMDKARGIGPFSLDEHVEQLRVGREISDGVVFTNGEPTLNRGLVDLVAAARDLDFQLIGIVTNGRRLGQPGYAASLIDAGMNEFTVSAHGPTATIHDAITRRPGSYDQTRRGMQTLAELRSSRRFTLHVNCTLVKKNLPHIVAMADYALGFGADRLNFNVVEARGTAVELFEAVQPLYTDVLDAALDSGLDFGSPRISLSRVPPCAGGMDWVQEDFHLSFGDRITHYEPAEGKVRGPLCTGCAAVATCPGLWKAYAEGHGWTGLRRVQPPRTEGWLRVRLGAPCLNRCTQCADGPNRPPGPPHPSVFRQLTEGYVDGHRRLVLAGGDPLLDARLPHYLQSARRMGYRRLAIETNGRLLTKDRFLDAVARLDLDEIIVKLHGRTAAQADAATGVRGSHRQALRAIARARDRRLRVSTRLVERRDPEPQDPGSIR